jgi:Uma2 family endonuclease
MATVTDSAPEMTLADLVEKFGPIPARRIRMAPAPGTATEDDLLTIMGREDRLYELVDGILLEKAIGQPEAELTFNISLIIGAFIRDRRLGIAVGPDGLMRLMPGLIRMPDISFVSWQRLDHRRPPKEQIASYGPELAIEVLSPSNTKKEMSDKLRDYFATGTRLVWYIDPKAGTVTVYELPDRSTVLRGGDTLTGGDILPGFEVAVDTLLTLPEPPAPPR